jgi:nucleoside-diphosphate-sugar epimerase
VRVLVMGGSRFMGPRVVEALDAGGHDVTVFNRGTRPPSGPPGVVHIQGDRNDPAALRVLRGRRLDAVVDMSAYLRSQTELLLDVLGSVAVWVHISSGAVYQPSAVLPWPESTPYGPWVLWGSYGIEKLGCEIALRGRRDPALATTALRFPFVLGPANYAPREEFIFNRLLDGAAILLPGDGRAVIQFVSSRQVGATVARAVELSGAGWRAYNIANPGFASLGGLVSLCAGVVGAEARIRHVPMPEGPFNTQDNVFPFPNENYVLDTSLSVADGLAPEPTTLPAMLEEAYRHLMAHPERRAWERSSAERAILGG